MYKFGYITITQDYFTSQTLTYIFFFISCSNETMKNHFWNFFKVLHIYYKKPYRIPNHLKEKHILILWENMIWHVGAITFKGAHVGLLDNMIVKPFLMLFIFSYESIWKWNFLWIIKNTYNCSNISHVLCKLLSNKYELFKVCKFCQIMCFVLKIIINFES